MTNKKSSIKNINFIIELNVILIIIMMIWLSFAWSKYNKTTLLTEIQISETKILDERSYIEFIEQIRNKNNSYFKSITNFIETHPYIKTARVSKHYPCTIKIEIIERKPIVFLKTEPLILLDKDGFVLPNKNNTNKFNLPVMTNINPDLKLYPYGKKVLSKKVKQCIAWLSLIQDDYIKLYNNISEIKITSTDEMEIILYDYPTNIYLGQKQFKSRIKNLIEFEKVLKPKKLSDFSYLDMRFKNQIIAKERRL